eukprot:scaffold42258_cov71-Cyclotella_meneghiniana.AAC.3
MDLQKIYNVGRDGVDVDVAGFLLLASHFTPRRLSIMAHCSTDGMLSNEFTFNTDINTAFHPQQRHTHGG